MLGHSRRRGHNRSRVMAADIVKPAQLTIRSTNHDERFACQLEGEKLPRARNLIDSPNRDPVVGEHLLALQPPDPLIDIPGGGNGVGVLERCFFVIKRQQIGEGIVHSATSPARAARARLIDFCPRRYTALPESSNTSVMAMILNSVIPGFLSSSAGNADRTMAAVVEKNPTQASGMATRLPPGKRSAPGGYGTDCSLIMAAKTNR